MQEQRAASPVRLEACSMSASTQSHTGRLEHGSAVADAEPMTPGRRALIEAARLESARIYGTVQREHRQLTDEQRVDNIVAAVRNRGEAEGNAAQAVQNPAKRCPQDALITMAIEAGETNHSIIQRLGVTYADVRAVRKRAMRGAA